ncbi:hypothetical protein BMS3Abin12_01566 [bacterium BMS3Abin12]|nr:hypothetical protein BMS3Abin12_01566 [bacterium BMS3Abin12]
MVKPARAFRGHFYDVARIERSGIRDRFSIGRDPRISAFGLYPGYERQVVKPPGSGGAMRSVDCVGGLAGG